MNGCIIPEENEKSINPQQENAIFLVMGDEAYTDEMIDEYNRNAEAKTEEFNTNATNKLNAFNENATTKTNAFNTNATTQTDTYNSNAATKLSEYNDNAAAKEQSYNSNADTKTQAFNQNAAQKTYEFNQNALAYQEGIEKNAEEIDEVSNRVYRIENNLYDSGTAEGDFINIEDSSYSEFQNVSVDGASEQVTTTGKNKIGFVNNTAIDNGLTITFADDNTITINGTSTTNLNKQYKILQDINKYVPDADYTAQIFYVGGSLNGSNERILFCIRGGLTEDTGSLTVSGYVGASKSQNYEQAITQKSPSDEGYMTAVQIMCNEGITFDNLKLKFQFEEGSTSTEFEPYTGSQPSPSPDYPQSIDVIEEDFNITSCGKNLLPNNITSQTINGLTITKNDDNSVTINGTTTAYTTLSFIENFILPKGDYTLSYHYNGQFPEQGSIWTIATDLEDNQIFGFPIDYNSTKTLNENTTFSKIGIAIQTDKEINNLTLYPMIERGIEATEYEPYQGTTTTIALPEGQFAAKISDTIKDQFRIVYNESDGNYHLYLDKNVGKVVLDGSEDWFHYNSGADENNTYPIATDNISTSTNEIIVMSNNFVAKSASYLYSNDAQGIGNSFTQLIVRVDKKTATTIEEWKTWLQLHNTIVYYQLANPQTIDIGKVQMPLTYYPVTNVFTDCPLLPTIEVAYYRDFKTTIEAMQKDIASNTSRIETLEEQLQSQAITISNLENRITALEPTQTESEVVEQ